MFPRHLCDCSKPFVITTQFLQGQIQLLLNKTPPCAHQKLRTYLLGKTETPHLDSAHTLPSPHFQTAGLQMSAVYAVFAITLFVLTITKAKLDFGQER